MADDDESLDEILSGNKTVPEITTEAQPESTEPARDEHGRFAPKEGEEAQPEAEAEQQEQPEAEAPEGEHDAPVAAVVAERRKRQASDARAEKLERDLAEMRGQMSQLTQRLNTPAPAPQPEPKPRPEMWTDPDAWGKSLIEEAVGPLQQQLTQTTERFSRTLAVKDHGAETVQAAYSALGQAMQSDPGAIADYRRIMASEHPYEAMVSWHKRSQAAAEIGNDPAAYRERLKAEILAELKGAQPDPQPSPSPRNPIVKLPPSLNRIPAGHSAPERDESLDEVLSAPRRRA